MKEYIRRFPETPGPNIPTKRSWSQWGRNMSAKIQTRRNAWNNNARLAGTQAAESFNYGRKKVEDSIGKFSNMIGMSAKVAEVSPEETEIVEQAVQEELEKVKQLPPAEQETELRKFLNRLGSGTLVVGGVAVRLTGKAIIVIGSAILQILMALGRGVGFGMAILFALSGGGSKKSKQSKKSKKTRKNKKSRRHP